MPSSSNRIKKIPPSHPCRPTVDARCPYGKLVDMVAHLCGPPTRRRIAAFIRWGWGLGWGWKPECGAFLWHQPLTAPHALWPQPPPQVMSGGASASRRWSEQGVDDSDRARKSARSAAAPNGAMLGCCAACGHGVIVGGAGGGLVVAEAGQQGGGCDCVFHLACHHSAMLAAKLRSSCTACGRPVPCWTTATWANSALDAPVFTLVAPDTVEAAAHDELRREGQCPLSSYAAATVSEVRVLACFAMSASLRPSLSVHVRPPP